MVTGPVEAAALRETAAPAATLRSAPALATTAGIAATFTTTVSLATWLEVPVTVRVRVITVGVLSAGAVNEGVAVLAPFSVMPHQSPRRFRRARGSGTY